MIILCSNSKQFEVQGMLFIAKSLSVVFIFFILKFRITFFRNKGGNNINSKIKIQSKQLTDFLYLWFGINYVFPYSYQVLEQTIETFLGNVEEKIQVFISIHMQCLCWISIVLTIFALSIFRYSKESNKIFFLLATSKYSEAKAEKEYPSPFSVSNFYVLFGKHKNTKKIINVIYM